MRHPKDILAEVKPKRSDRKRQSLYLSASLFDKFRKVCGDASASQVIEELMEDFIKKLSPKAER